MTPRRNHHVVHDVIFTLKDEEDCRPNVRLDEQYATVEVFARLIVMGIVSIACLLVWWARQ